MPHNKKRNSLLAYELLVRSTAQSLLEGDSERAKNAVLLLKHSFRKGSELNKEFRMARALIDERVSSDVVAVRVITNCQLEARKFDRSRLEAEKNSLYEGIEKLKDAEFWDRKIDADDYKAYATVHQLLNAFRGTGPRNVDHVTFLENRLIEHMTRAEKKSEPALAPERDRKTMRLAVQLMTEKFDKKYTSLSDRQREIINAYALFKLRRDDESRELVESLLKQSDVRTLETCESYSKEERGETSRVIVETMKRVNEKSKDAVDDASVARRLMQEKLCDEIEGQDD